jgi:hypothetical protein
MAIHWLISIYNNLKLLPLAARKQSGISKQLSCNISPKCGGGRKPHASRNVSAESWRLGWQRSGVAAGRRHAGEWISKLNVKAVGSAAAGGIQLW